MYLVYKNTNSILETMTNSEIKQLFGRNVELIVNGKKYKGHIDGTEVGGNSRAVRLNERYRDSKKTHVINIDEVTSLVANISRGTGIVKKQLI